MEIKAKLIEIMNTIRVSDKFQKREFVAEYVPEKSQYQEYLKFEIVQEKCEMLDAFKVGEHVEILFNLKGRKWINPKGETVYFNSLQAWKLKKITDQSDKDSSPDAENMPFDDLNVEDVPF